MKKYALEYSGYKFEYFSNLGDEIQTLAAVRLLGGVDGYVSREGLNSFSEQGLVSLNGFFMGSDNWPPSPTIKPIFFSFHLSPKFESVVCSPEGVEYLKKHEPIGCRDQGTVEVLKRYGVEAYYSRCVTLTLPKRTQAQAEGAKEVFVVGVDKELESVIPRKIRKSAVRINQSSVRLPKLACPLKRDLGRALLDGYANNAKLVITSKIHCAMPCLAMGIPVIFLYPADKQDDYRVHLISDFIPVNYISRNSMVRRLGLQTLLAPKIDWAPKPVEMEDAKRAIEAGYAAAVQQALR